MKTEKTKIETDRKDRKSENAWLAFLQVDATCV